ARRQDAGRPDRSSTELLHQFGVPIENTLGGFLERLGLHGAHGSHGLHFFQEVDDFGLLLGRESFGLFDDDACGHGFDNSSIRGWAEAGSAVVLSSSGRNWELRSTLN